MKVTRFLGWFCIPSIYFVSCPTSAGAEGGSPSVGASRDYRSLFEQTFGKKKQAEEHAIFSTLMVSNRQEGKIRVRIGAEPEKVKIQFSSLKQVLGRFIKPEILTRLKALTDDEGYLELADFSILDFKAKFDSQQLVTHLEIPAKSRELQTFSLRSFSPNFEGVEVFQSDNSAIINFHAAQDFVEAEERKRREPAAFNLSGAINVSSWVLETDMTYREKAKKPWQRQRTRLVKDFPEEAVRVSLGDLSYRTASFQGSLPSAGISIERNFGLQPYRGRQASGAASFTVQHPSRVEILINNQVVYSERLLPGPYNLRDLPLTTGTNDVVVRIEDEFGRVEEKYIPFFYDATLLQKGLHDYSYVVALPSIMEGDQRTYKKSQAFVSFFHNYGLTDYLTAGYNLQVSKNQQQVGLKSIFSLPLGNFSVDIAGSRHQKHRGFAATLQYQWVPKGDKKNKTFTFLTQYRSLRFGSLGMVHPENPSPLSLSAAYQHSFNHGLSLSIGSSFNLGRRGMRNTNSQSLALSKTFSNNISLSLNMHRERRSPLGVDRRVLIGLTWRPSGSSHSFSNEYNPKNQEARLQWNYSGSSLVGGVNSNVTMGRTKDTRTLTGNLSYTGNRFVTSVTHNIDSLKSKKPLHRTSLRFGTALVFTGNKEGSYVTFARPIIDSFAIVKPIKSLEGVPLKVNPTTTNEYKSVATEFGGAVVNDLSSYYVSPIHIATNDLPLGTEIKNDDFYIKPSYRSGALIKIGTDAVVIIKGQMHFEDGTFLALKGWELVNLDDQKAEPLLFFTNQKGKFSVGGLRAGRYEMRLLDDARYHYHLEIAQGTKGVVKLERIVIKKAEEGSE